MLKIHTKEWTVQSHPQLHTTKTFLIAFQNESTQLPWRVLCHTNTASTCGNGEPGGRYLSEVPGLSLK
ncbi:hypothetical protein Ae201684P_001105 [Aphanomyces euteiches]|nr:hypothetical protein Ae201684P_001105 [Aphanomyces euteiches]